MLGDSATVNPETVIEWKSKELPKIVDGYQPKDIFLMLMKPDSSIISSPVRHWHTKVILAMAEKIKAEGHCSARIQCWWHREITTTGDWKVQQTRLLQKSKKLPTKYTPNFNSRMTSATFEEFLVQLNRQTGTNQRKICCSLTNVLHTQEIPLLWKIFKLHFSPQIAQAICNRWIRWSFMFSNANAESNSYGRQ